jgi:hypothetical protein
VTTDAAALICCCATQEPCCALTSVLFSIQNPIINFDFEFDSPIDGLRYRRFTSNAFANGQYVPGAASLTSNLLVPLVINRVGPNTTDSPFGTLGRCGYRGSRTFQSGGAFTGWTGSVITVRASLPPTTANSIVWDGRAVPIGQSSGQVWYYIRPIRTGGWNETTAPWAFEAGIVCGNITAGCVRGWPPNGCPLGDQWSSASYVGNFNYYRGKVRAGGSTFGSTTNLTEPQWNAQTAAQFAISFPPSEFRVNIT